MAREREKDRGGEKRTRIKDKGGVRKFEWERRWEEKRDKDRGGGKRKERKIEEVGREKREG